MHSTRTTTLAVLLLLLAALPAGGQSFSIALRGGAGLPLGHLAQDPTAPGRAEILQGARVGFGYGLDAALHLLPAVGLYTGFDRMAFDCAEAACGRENSYTFSGVNAGVVLTPLRVAGLAPWVRGGVAFQQLSGSYRAESGIGELTSDHAPGFEFGAGVAVPILGVLSLTPQVRYLGQSPRARVHGIQYGDGEEDSPRVGYLAFELGLGVRTGSAAGLLAVRR